MANTKTAVLGGGCFWCVEAALLQLEGVLKVESGYMGGHTDQPSYEQVCGGDTGHVEVVRVEFDPAVISYGELLEVFFTAHDPTTLNRQGNDVGTQYRSVIFVLDEAQRAEAERVIAELEKEKVFDAPIVTSIEPARTFWKAEGIPPELFCKQLTPALLPICRGPQGGEGESQVRGSGQACRISGCVRDARSPRLSDKRERLGGMAEFAGTPHNGFDEAGDRVLGGLHVHTELVLAQGFRGDRADRGIEHAFYQAGATGTNAEQCDIAIDGGGAGEGDDVRTALRIAQRGTKLNPRSSAE